MLPEHKNPIFVSKRPKISEKSPILTQNCRFCARKAGKWGSRSQKAHKNADFVLERAENEGSRPKKRTKTLILCSEEHGTARSGQARQGTSTRNGTRPPGTKRNGPKHNETQPPRNATATQRTQHTQRNTTQHTQRNRNATQPQRNCTMGNNKKGDNLSGCLL